VTPALGPDATGVGWVYEYALVDRTGRHDLSQLRALQDWFLKYELKAVPNVAEVATLGGAVREYQIVLQPDRMRAYGVTHRDVIDAVNASNQESGGSVLELAEANTWCVRPGICAHRRLPENRAAHGRERCAVRLGDVARVQIGPAARRGIAELDGQGEVTGGIIVMRSGKNALETIAAVKAKLATLKASLPPGVEVVEPTIAASSSNARSTISPANSSKNSSSSRWCVSRFCFTCDRPLVAIVSLPLGVLIAFIVMQRQGINANIMSLGGIAIAIGAMVDAAIVMIENAHKHIEHWRAGHRDEILNARERWTAHRRCQRAGGAGALLQPVDHHVVVHSDLHAGSAGRAVVCPACVHQDICDGRGRGTCGHADSRTDGLPDSRQDSGGGCQSLNRWLVRLYRPILERVSRGRAQPSASRSYCSRSPFCRYCVWVVSSCRRSTRATSCTCLQRCQDCQPARPRNFCSRWTAC